jgi:dTDP-4-amino-4,6-dideoxygalactose transaminase
MGLGELRYVPYVTTGLLLPRVTDPAAQAVRAANYSFLLKRLGHLVPEYFVRLPEGASPFAFPIQSERKHELLDRLSKNGIGAAGSWTFPHPCLPATKFPRAAALRERIILLPVHQELGIRELERIVDAVLDNLEAMRRGLAYKSPPVLGESDRR